MIIMPIQQRKEMIEVCSNQLQNCQHEKYESHVDNKPCGDEYKSNVDKRGDYWNLGLSKELFLVVIPPTVVYLVLRSLGFLLLWITRGFKT
jgi:hypothetical protein